MRIPVIVAVAAFALCRVQRQSGGQSLVQDGPRGRRGPDFPNYNPYDPTKYGQTSGFYAGGSGR